VERILESDGSMEIYRLGDLDFADDITLLGNSWKGMNDLTDRTREEAATFGLNINPEMTKIMKIGNRNPVGSASD